MKSRMRQILRRAFGGQNKLLDWRTFCFAILAIIACIANLLHIIIINHEYCDLYIPVIWFIAFVYILIKGNKAFYEIFLIFGIFTIISDKQGYKSLSLFILILSVLTKNKNKQYATTIILTVITIIACSVYQLNMMNIFAVLFQTLFGIFVYYGFIYIRVADISNCSKLIYTDEERVVLHALATQDKSQKEVAYELGMQIHEVTYILNRVKRKNRINTTDMLLRLYAIEITKAGN